MPPGRSVGSSTVGFCSYPSLFLPIKGAWVGLEACRHLSVDVLLEIKVVGFLPDTMKSHIWRQGITRVLVRA